MTEWYHRLTWTIFRYSYARKLNKEYGVTVTKDITEPEAPYLFLSNHANFSDPFLVSYPRQHPINYMANVDGVTLSKKILSPLVGIFPKKKGLPDSSAVKKAIRLIKSNHIVGIFPEGDRSWDGETDCIHESIAPLAKKMNVPIVLANMKGNYLTWPRWAETKRKGKIFIEYSLISQAELKQMDAIRLAALIQERLYRNDIKDSLLKKTAFSGSRLAHGIQYLLWLCPSCMSHDSITGKDNTILCSSCNTSWELNANLTFLPQNKTGNDLKDWFEWQKTQIQNLYNSAEDNIITATKQVSLYDKKDAECSFYADGGLELRKNILSFIPDAGQQKLEFGLHDIKYYIDNFNNNMEFSCGHKRYRVLLHGKNACKWIFFFRFVDSMKPKG